MNTNTELLVGLIESVGNERPDLLPMVIDLAANSPYRHALLDAAILFDTTLEAFAMTFQRVARDLDQLEKRQWRHPDHVVESPNLAGLLVLCRARQARESTSARSRKLAAIERKLSRLYEIHTTRQWIEDFIT